MDLHIRQLINGLNDSMSFTHEELSRLPTFRATGSIVGSDCAICHEDIDGEELLRNLPGCNHTFHQFCIDNWLRQNPTCPLCRNNVRISFLYWEGRGEEGFWVRVGVGLGWRGVLMN